MYLKIEFLPIFDSKISIKSIQKEQTIIVIFNIYLIMKDSLRICFIFMKVVKQNKEDHPELDTFFLPSVIISGKRCLKSTVTPFN